MHEVRRHRDERAVGQQEIAFVPEFLDAGKNVIPSPAVQAGGMIAQFVENFVHLERSGNRLDQYRRANRSLRNAQLILREFENIIPDARFEMALHFRQIKIRAAAARDQLLRVVEKIQTEIEQTARDRLAIDEHMFLDQMPAARTHE